MNDDDEDYVYEQEQDYEQEVNLFELFPQQVLLRYFLSKFHVVRML